jgi:hypothetical protein
MNRTPPCTKADARARFAVAAGYIEAAERTLLEENAQEFLNVAAGNAVLAGIAASDAICCVRLGLRHRGENHRDATDLLRGATPDGTEIARTLARLLSIKDEVHYGIDVVASGKAEHALRWARKLVDRARQEVEA